MDPPETGLRLAYDRDECPPVQADDPGWTEPPEGPDLDDALEPDFEAEADMPVPAAHLPLIDIGEWVGKSPPAREFAWGDMIPLLTTTMLTGPGGVGKSLFEQMLCTCIALGRPFLGLETRRMNTLYVTCEDDASELWRRQQGICASLGIPLKAVIGKLHLASLCGEDGTALASFDSDGKMTLTDRWRQLELTCEELDIRLYAFDNATDAMAGDLNDIHQVAEFVNLFTGLALRLDGAAMVLHHPNKAGDDWLGSVAWHNKVRSRLVIKRSETEGDSDGRVVENPKANYGASGGKIAFRWWKGAFIRDEDMPDDARGEMDALIRSNGAAERFLKCLAKTLEEKRNVSHSSAAANYAPRLFAKMTTGHGYTVQDYERAMERLLHTGDIRGNEPVFQYDNRTWAKGLKLMEDGGAALPESRQEFEEKCFIACLGQRNKQRRAVSEQPSRTYAPAVFEAMDEARGCTREQFAAAMDRLFHKGAIERGFLWVLKGEGKAVHGLREVSDNAQSDAQSLHKAVHKGCKSEESDD